MRHVDSAQDLVNPDSVAGPRRRFFDALTRLLPGLLAWTRGRLPRSARRRADTEDPVQDAMVGALVHGETLEAAPEDGVLFYLRRSVLNQIQDEVRRSDRGEVETITSDPRVDPRLPPDAQASARETRRHFQQALDRLGAEDQALVIGRVELHLSCEELARLLGAASPAAVRMASKRAVVRLGREMGRLEAELATGQTRIEPSASPGEPSTPS